MDHRLYQQIGERLRNARERKGVSQEELARELGYSSAATISHFETGQRKISVADLLRLGSILGVSLEYLYGGTDLTAQMPYFRAKAATINPTERESVASFLSFAHLHSQISRALPQGIENLKPGHAADRILEMVGITEPPVSSHEVAKWLQVSVFQWDFPDEISGLLVLEGGSASIGVNENHPYVRQRFTVAHELGHFVYHSRQGLFVDFADAQIAVLTDTEEQKQERQANWFAADLLMPRRWIAADFHAHGEESTAYLAQRYGVSEQALWFRLLNLKLVNPPTA